MRKTRLRQLCDEGSAPARAVARLRSEPERFLATVQIAMTVVGVAASAFGGAQVAARLAVALRRLGAGDASEQLALALVVALISFLTIVLGELVPKSLALRSAEGYALLAGRPLRGLSWLARPLVWVLTASSNAVLRLFGDRTTFTEARLSPSELQQLLEEATTTGGLNQQTGEIASRAFDLEKLSVGAVMVTRSRMVMIPRDIETRELTRVLGESGHARLPVYEGARDNVVGYVTARDVFAQLYATQTVALGEILRAAYFVPESVAALVTLRELQRRRMHLAIVVDEQGGLTGLVTIEDMLEELVGEITQEHEMPPSIMKPEPDGSYLLEGATPIRDINRALDLSLPHGADASTIAGLAIRLAGVIPRVGEALALEGGTTIEVVTATPRKVQSVRLRPGTPGHGREPPAPE